MRLRHLLQTVLHRFGYQLVRNSRPKPLVGFRHDPSSSVPAALKSQLVADNLRLTKLRQRYASARLPMLSHTWWTGDYISKSVDLAHFRGDNAYVWQTRHLKGSPEHLYYLYARDVAERDHLGLFSKLTEDGAFGCWIYKFHRFPALSRDLLDSVNELNFLDRHAGVTKIAQLQVLDIGAGYGRLAHRSNEALPKLKVYYCTDAIPESTFLCEIYVHFRQCSEKTQVVPIDQLANLDTAKPDLAINVHSFSEMCLAAIEGWLDLVQRLKIPWLFIVPNDPESFLTMEADGTRRDYLDAIESRGYRLAAKEPAICDPDTRELAGIQDHLFLFKRDVRS